MAAKPNVTTNFLPSDTNWIQRLYPMAASAAFAQGAAMGIEISGNTTTGNLTLMGTENAAGADFKGIMAETIAATDSDYATAGKLKSVWIPLNREAEAEFTVVNGTFTAVDVEKTVQFAATSLGLDVDTAGKGARITKYLNSTRGKCKFDLPTTETA